MECVDLTCTECGNDYSSKKKLEQHKKIVHTLLKCDECKKQVVGYKNMKNHKQNHVMKVCQHCDIVFSMNVLASPVIPTTMEDPNEEKADLKRT